jgi:ATP-dependent helicase/DNAse subunit B
MQALIYLFAMADINSGYKPAGAFYRLVNGGKLSSKPKPYGIAGDAKDLYKNRMETQRTSGVMFGEANDIEAINAEFKRRTSARKKFMELENLEEAEFTQLVEAAAKQLREKLNALYSGDVRAVPVYSKTAKTAPCKYCDYKRICGNAGRLEEVRVGEKN